MGAQRLSLAWGIGAALALALALALIACGPKADSGKTEQGAGQTQAPANPQDALDPCAGQIKALCADKALAPLSGQMKSALFEAASAVSPEGDEVLARNQQSWLESQRVACAVASNAATVTPAQQACLKQALVARVQEAGEAVEKIGPFTFQRVEINQTTAVVETAAAAGMGPGAPTTVSRDIKYPRIDGDSPAIRKFNDAVRQSPRFKLEDQAEENTTYNVAYAGDDLVSVRFDTYDFTLGAAHPNNSMRAVTINMQTGEPLSAGDVFKAGARWQDFLAARAARDVTAALKNEDEMAQGVTAAEMRRAVASPDAWLVTDKALVLLLPPESFGRPGAVGSQEVSVSWRDLKPYLNPQGPGPIKRP